MDELLNQSTGEHLRAVARRMDLDQPTDDLDAGVVRLAANIIENLPPLLRACDIARTVFDGGIVEVRYMKDPPLWGWGWRVVTADQADQMRGEVFTVVARVRMFGMSAS